MPKGSEEEERLEAALAGITRVAEAIAALPAEDIATALEAAERSYCNTALVLGYAEAQARGWAAMVMINLRAELEKRKLATQCSLEPPTV